MSEPWKAIRGNLPALVLALAGVLLLNLGILLHVAEIAAIEWVLGLHGAALACGIGAYLKMR